nr:MAG TPA: hypothetical protein [Caudoviricetes sp.]
MPSAASAPHTSVLAWYKGGANCDTIRVSVFLLVFLGAVQSVQIMLIGYFSGAAP